MIYDIERKVNEIVDFINLFCNTITSLLFTPITFIKDLIKGEKEFVSSNLLLSIISMLSINNLKYFLMILSVAMFDSCGDEDNKSTTIPPAKVELSELFQFPALQDILMISVLIIFTCTIMIKGSLICIRLFRINIDRDIFTEAFKYNITLILLFFNIFFYIFLYTDYDILNFFYVIMFLATPYIFIFLHKLLEPNEFSKWKRIFVALSISTIICVTSYYLIVFTMQTYLDVNEKTLTKEGEKYGERTAIESKIITINKEEGYADIALISKMPEKYLLMNSDDNIIQEDTTPKFKYTLSKSDYFISSDNVSIIRINTPTIIENNNIEGFIYIKYSLYNPNCKKDIYKTVISKLSFIDKEKYDENAF